MIVGSAIERVIQLRRYSIVGAAVTVLWLLSPLGGQSSLRVLDITSSDVTSQGHIKYYNTTTSLGYSWTFFGSADSLGYGSPVIAALLETSLLAPITATKSPVDSWNNV